MNFPNARQLAALLCVLTVSSLACSFFDRFAKNTQTDKVNSFNYSVPFGLASAEHDPEADSDSRFVIFLTFASKSPDIIDLKIGSIDSPKVDLAGVAEGLNRYASTRTSEEKVAYIAAEADIPQVEIEKVIDVIHEQGFSNVRFLVSSFERFPPSKARYSNREEWTYPDVPGPDKIFETQLLQSRPSNEKPNPLNLVVSIEGSNKLYLNNERYESGESLQKELADIFKLRTENVVLREGSNEVEKTVFLRLRPEPSGIGKPLNYRQFVELIDLLKLAGASPIVLGSPTNDPRVAVVGDSPPSRLQQNNNVPKTISGGVLNSKATSLPKPPYPPAAKAVRASGSVNVQVTVDENGNVIEANAVSGHPLLKAAAVQSAKSARFAPTMLGGQPVKVTGVIIFNFVSEP